MSATILYSWQSDIRAAPCFKGVSAAFIRELVRKAALAAADQREELVVEDRHLDEPLYELLVEGDGLTRSLLGAQGPERS